MASFQLSVWKKDPRAQGGYRQILPSIWTSQGFDGWSAAVHLAAMLVITDWTSTPQNKGRPTYIIRNETPET